MTVSYLVTCIVFVSHNSFHKFTKRASITSKIQDISLRPEYLTGGIEICCSTLTSWILFSKFTYGGTGETTLSTHARRGSLSRIASCSPASALLFISRYLSLQKLIPCWASDSEERGERKIVRASPFGWHSLLCFSLRIFETDVSHLTCSPSKNIPNLSQEAEKHGIPTLSYNRQFRSLISGLIWNGNSTVSGTDPRCIIGEIWMTEAELISNELRNFSKTMQQQQI